MRTDTVFDQETKIDKLIVLGLHSVDRPDIGFPIPGEKNLKTNVVKEQKQDEIGQIKSAPVAMLVAHNSSLLGNGIRP